MVVTASRRRSDIAEVPIAVTALTGETLSQNGGDPAEVEVQLADVSGERPYLTALDQAASADRLTVLAMQEESFGKLPAFYLDVAEWFRLKGEEAIARPIWNGMAIP